MDAPRPGKNTRGRTRCGPSYSSFLGGDPLTDAQARAQVARQQWLLYYNRTLLEQGLISQRAHDRMLLKIRGRFAAPPGREP